MFNKLDHKSTPKMKCYELVFVVVGFLKIIIIIITIIIRALLMEWFQKDC